MPFVARNQTAGHALYFHEPHYSIDEVALESLGAAERTVPANTVLGQVTKGTGSSAADGDNAGNGTMGSITVSAGAKPGVYRLTVIGAVTNAGAFNLEDPDGIIVDSGDVAAAFSAGGIAFTLADGSTDFAVGDAFNITVAVGSLKFQEHEHDNSDGTEHAVAVLLNEAVVPASGDLQVAVIARFATYRKGGLIYQSDITGGEKTTAEDELAAINPPIVTRDT